MKTKFKNYEAIYIHEKDNKIDKITSMGCDFAAEALRRFKESKTANKMILYVATHNNTRLKIHAEYGMEYK